MPIEGTSGAPAIESASIALQQPSVSTVMEAIRRIEGNDYAAVKSYSKGVTGLGAYQITRSNWDEWSRGAGIAGADWRHPGAQDRVAAYAITRLFERYGNADLVAAAWYGGSKIADQIARSGKAIEDTPFSDTIRYVNEYRNILDALPFIPDTDLPDIPTEGSNWLFPVAGENSWSRGGFLYHRTDAQIAAGKSKVHEGIDIMAARGTPIVAPVAGNVVGSGYSNTGGYWAKIRGDDGIDYYFSHMDQQALVGSGQRVGQGFHIGFVGNSGNASDTKPHLHFTMHRSSDRALLNPSEWLDGGATASGQYRTYDPHASYNEAVEQPGALSNAGGFIDQVSTAVAGGQRTDYRTLGLEELEQERSTENIELGANPWGNQ